MKKHWAAFLLVFILGFLMVLPSFYFQYSLGGQYGGILKELVNDELFYMARIKDTMDGHVTLGNAYLWEHKDQLPQQLFLPEFLLAQPLKFLNFDIVQGRILYSFVLPAIAFVLTYTVFYLIYPSRFWAVLFSAFLFFGLYLFKFIRPVVPQFVFLFWLSQFIFLWQLIKNPSNKTFKLLNILNLGLLFYIYPFYWTFYTVFLAVSVFLCFFKDRFLSKQFIKILIGSLLIGSIYFYLTFLAGQLPEYQETLTRLQLVYSHSPSEVKSVSLSLVVLLLIGVLNRVKAVKINKEILFFIAGIVSVLIVTNQNIITGQKFEFGHYRMQAVFFSIFALYYLFNHLRFSDSRLKVLLVSMIVITCSFGVFGYSQKTLKISDHDLYIQKYASVFDWLNKNTTKDSVVYANQEISSFVPVYTSNNVFYSRYANLFIISDKEILDRFVLNDYFEIFDRDFVIENERSIWGVRHVDRYGEAVQANKWRQLLGLKLKDETRLPESEIQRVMVAAGEIKKKPLKESLGEYRVDYLIWDKNKDPDWRPQELDIKAVYDFEDIYIFEI